MTAETWNIIFIVMILFLAFIDSFLLFVVLKQNKTIRWASNKIRKLITGDNLEMSLDTLSLYYHLPVETIEEVLQNEQSTREFRDH